MTEDVFVRSEADALTERIVSRLGERQRKAEQMAAWERESHQAPWRPALWLAAMAACIALAVVLWPRQELSPLDELGIGMPELTEYRAATPGMAQIEQLISEENYDEALRQVQKALKNSDLAISELENIPELWADAEEMAYEDELERARNSELRWACICLLVRTGQHREARKELKAYLKHPQFCAHAQEARVLLEKIKSRK